MNPMISLLLVTFTTAIATAQSLENLKEKYQSQSPLSYGRLGSTPLVAPEESHLTPEEERLAELKAQELAEKQAMDEKVYLDTDFKFFQSLAVPLQEDELDKAFKKDLVAKDLEQSRFRDSTVRTEIKTSAPVPMSRAEGVAADTRRQLLMQKISENARNIKACVIESTKKGVAFKGSEMTLMWDVSTLGRVEVAKINSTDVANEEVKKCILQTVSSWNFSEAMKNRAKRSRVHYTFRFTKEAKADLAAAGQ